MLVFQLIYHIHQFKLQVHTMKVYGIWDIPLQNIEFFLEFKMIRFFSGKVCSAQILRTFYVFFVTIMVMAYLSMLRSALVAQKFEEPLNSVQVIYMKSKTS